MAEEVIYNEANSEEIREIITAVPGWILKWGITIVFAILMGIILLSNLIEYPDITKVTLKVNSLNSPKPVLAMQSGKLVRLLAGDGDIVKQNQSLAYFESTGDPEDVLRLNKELKKFRSNTFSDRNKLSALPDNLNLGELQSAYQNFYQQYLEYQSTEKNGYYLNKMSFLEKELKNISNMKIQIMKQQKIQQLEYANKEHEYNVYQKLYKNKVISRGEFTQQENTYLAAKYPLQQTETTLLNNVGSYSSKEKELLELKHTIAEEKAKFIQALNQCLNECDGWILQHVLRAPVSGRLSYAGIVQQNQNLAVNQEVFIVDPGNTSFFGEVQIPQYDMGKVHKSEKVLIKMRSYPFEQFGMIRGRLAYVSDVAFRDSIFIGRVRFENFENKDNRRKIILKNGMQADAEIITEESSLLKRFYENLYKVMSN